jgi:hypothetical protein
MNAQKSGLALGAVLFSAIAALAQPYSIDWHAIGGGGGTSSGGAFTLSATLGQLEASPQPMAGGSFSITGGFWSLLAIQNPDAPLLSIARQGADLLLFWTLSGTGFVLEESPSPTGAWSQVSLPYETNATHVSVTAPLPARNSFYRLRQQ